MFDMFGRQLEVGQHVAYADEGWDDKPILCIYRIVEIISPEICTAELLNGGTENWYYLENTTQRCCVIGSPNELYTTAMYYSDSIIN